MHIQKLYLRSFRNYEAASMELSSGVNVFQGNNAQGKTNLLEALHFLIAGRSFRTLSTSELIQYQASSFQLEVHFVKHGIEQMMRISYGGKKRSLFHNSTEYGSFVQLIGLIQGVMLSPQDTSLICGSPQVRRTFLDLQIAQVDPLYVHHLTRYQRAMKHRNVLLKNKSLLGIESWEHEMSASAAYISLQRKRTLAMLGQTAEMLYLKLSGKDEKLHLTYKNILVKEEGLQATCQAFVNAYMKYRPQEVYMGYSLVGPHRDDFDMLIQGKDARRFASEGQKRTLIAALRFAEWDRIYKESADAPIMFVDDIGLSLDQRRKSRLFDHLGSLGQVFVTSAEELPKECFPVVYNIDEITSL